MQLARARGLIEFLFLIENNFALAQTIKNYLFYKKIKLRLALPLSRSFYSLNLIREYSRTYTYIQAFEVNIYTFTPVNSFNLLFPLNHREEVFESRPITILHIISAVYNDILIQLYIYI